MKNIMKQYIYRLKENRVVKQMNMAYIVIASFILILFSFVIIMCSCSLTMERMEKSERQMIIQSCGAGDFIFREVNLLIEKNIVSSSGISDALYGKIADNNTKINNDISRLASSSGIIESIYIVNFKENKVYSSVAPTCSVEAFFDEDIINILMESKNNDTIYKARRLSYTDAANGIEEYDIISCVYNNSSNGAVVANISLSDFRAMINLYNGKYDISNTIVMQSNGDVLSRSDEGKFEQDKEESEILGEIVKRNDDSGKIIKLGKVINYVRSSYLGFYYVQITDVRQIMGGFGLMFLMVPFFILLMVLLFGASLLYAVNFFSEPEAETEKKEEKPTGQKIKYNFLNTKRSELIQKILVGTFTYSEEELRENGIVFDNPYFGVVMARIDRMKEIEPANIPMIKYGIMNIGDEVLSSVGRVYSLESNEYDIVWIINYDELDSILPAVKQIQEFVESIYKITASFGCNFGAESPEDISDFYHNAQYSLSYRLSMGYNSIIMYSSVKDCALNICEYPETLEQEILSDVMSQNIEAMKNNVHSFMESIKTAPYSTVITHANRLLTAVDSAAGKVSGSDDSITVNNVEIMTRMETIDEIETFVFNRCESVSLKFSNIKTDSKQDIIAKAVKDFIDEHFRDSNLSIDMIAKEVNRSANYTRSIFKQSQGLSISDYIASKRFEEVCRMLVETDVTAQDIGKSIGLNSGSYFYTAFKKHTGYTPDQYRKIYGNKEE